MSGSFVLCPSRNQSSVQAESSTDDGNCVIEIDQVVPGITQSDSATGAEISEAAWNLINQCAQPAGRGGTVSLIGQSSNEHTSSMNAMRCLFKSKF